MKINRKARVIQLGAAETKQWEDGGPAGHAFRALVREIAESMIRTSGKVVEIYASQSAGGWMADQLVPETSLGGR